MPARRLAAVALVLAAAAAVRGETIAIDATADQHPISPLVYGVAFASQAALSDLNCPLNRHGGNGTSRYNWQVNASNHANDWYYESIDDGSATAGASIDSFISGSRAGGAQPLVTIPMLDWVARLGPSRSKLCSFSQAKYGAQSGNDSQWFPDAGNGVKSGGGFVTGNDPTDANVAADATFEKGLVQHLVAKWGAAAAGGQKWYILDNEHSIWHSTHRDVHPTGATMEEVRDKMVGYATMIKGVDADALVVGPEEWGWSGYLYSGYDQQYGGLHGWSTLPDRDGHGGADYLPWLLQQLKSASDSAGKRLLDVFSVHWYPQGGEYGDDTSSATQLRRNRSTRSLWDPNYTDETWVNAKVQLIPRLKQWVAAYYPGTRVALTEYNWGAEGHISGATAQADVFGILGREGCDLATRWTTPDASTPTYLAMKLWRNYDGAKSTFGDQNARATAANPDNLSAFAAKRSSDGALTVMLVHKELSGTVTPTLSLSHFSAASAAHVWQLTSSNAIVHLPDVAVAGGQLTVSLPAQSVTLVVVPPATGGTTTSGTTTSGTTTSGTTTSGTGASGTTTGSGTTGSTSGPGGSGGGTTTGSSAPVRGGGSHSGCGLGGWFGGSAGLALLSLRRARRR
jgi:hypothetical protein